VEQGAAEVHLFLKERIELGGAGTDCNRVEAVRRPLVRKSIAKKMIHLFKETGKTEISAEDGAFGPRNAAICGKTEL